MNNGHSFSFVINGGKAPHHLLWEKGILSYKTNAPLRYVSLVCWRIVFGQWCKKDEPQHKSTVFSQQLGRYLRSATETIIIYLRCSQPKRKEKRNGKKWWASDSQQQIGWQVSCWWARHGTTMAPGKHSRWRVRSPIVHGLYFFSTVRLV